MGNPEGVTISLRLASGNCDERPIGDIFLSEERHDACLTDKGFSLLAWEWHWLEDYGALMAATPKHNSRRAWRKEDRRWAASKRQVIEGVISQLKDFITLERHRARMLSGPFEQAGSQGCGLHTCG